MIKMDAHSTRTLIRTFLRLLGAGLILWSIPLTASARETPLSKVQSCKDSTVSVKARAITIDGGRATVRENSGAGIIIDPSGLIVTNTHVIYGSNIITVTLTDGSSANAAVAFISKTYDFSILKVSPSSPLIPIQWADSDLCALGQNIITIGHSPLLNQTISGGTINGMGTRMSSDGTATPVLIEVSINHYPGDSGGPVFNTAGEFLGLIDSKRTTIQRATFAIPSNMIRTDYLRLKNALPAADPSSELKQQI
jgi:S1-C subfamily serine protease